MMMMMMMTMMTLAPTAKVRGIVARPGRYRCASRPGGEHQGPANSLVFADFYRTYRELAVRVAVRTVGATEAEDAVQNAFAKLWRRHCQTGETRQWTPQYLVRTVRTLALDETRRQARELKRVNRYIEWAPAAETDCGINWDALELKDHIRALKPGWQRLIDLYYYQGFTSKEIAPMMNTTPNAIKAQIYRACRALRQRARDDEPVRPDS